MSFRRDVKGQAAAELAAVIPIFLLFMVLLAEVGLVMVDQMAVERAAREGARTAAVTSSVQEIKESAYAATDLSRHRTTVSVGQRPDGDGMVEVNVRYESRIVMPFTGAVLFRPQLKAEATMRVEGIKATRNP
jgi:Flp pilus assembly protein TadG